MRKSFYIYSVVGALLSLLCMVNCTDRELFQGQHADGVAGFSLQEAKEYFEEQAGTEPVMSRSAGRAALDPGDFAPYWESAVASSQCRLGSYDVPIAPAYRFKAVVADGNGRAGKVEVGQKLVVVKNLDTGRMSQYILSLIPTRSLAPRSGRQLCDAFVNCGDKGGFSGLAVYTCVYSSVVACVSRYEDGRRMEGVFLLDAPDASELHRRIDYARHLLSSVAVRAHRAVTTRFEWDIDGGELNGGELPEVVITPDDDYTWPPDDWLHPGYDDYETPEPEDNNSDGNEDPGYTGNTPADQEGGGSLQGMRDALEKELGAKIEGVIKQVTIKTGEVSNSKLAEQTMSGKFNDILYGNSSITLTLSSSLTEIQQMIVLAHEYMHLMLLEISRNAGSPNAFYDKNSELYNDIVHSKEATDVGKINDGHHQYMGGHIEEVEDLLREAFPGKEQDFYEYGKWGGGATESDEFEKLSESEQSRILDYLNDKGL